MVTRYAWAALLGGCLVWAATAQAGLLIDDQPMFGGQPRTPEEQQQDATFIENMTRLAGSREQAGVTALGQGWDALKAGDYSMAIQRFNDAWLLLPEHPNVYLAFATYYNDHEQLNDAIAMYRRSLTLDPQQPVVMCDLARTLRLKALRLQGLGLAQSRAPAEFLPEEIELCLRDAQQLYEQAAQMTTQPQELGYIYYHWAVLRAQQEDYADAWRKVHLAQKHDGGFIETTFLDELNAAMKEPKPPTPPKPKTVAPKTIKPKTPPKAAR